MLVAGGHRRGSPSRGFAGIDLAPGLGQPRNGRPLDAAGRPGCLPTRLRCLRPSGLREPHGESACLRSWRWRSRQRRLSLTPGGRGAIFLIMAASPGIHRQIRGFTYGCDDRVVGLEARCLDASSEDLDTCWVCSSRWLFWAEQPRHTLLIQAVAIQTALEDHESNLFKNTVSPNWLCSVDQRPVGSTMGQSSSSGEPFT
ncbi:hypothetical protein F5883DRAFT_682484 [Diaporthe sp. PMI_573]|nr:hypothetical protein F5883DRAFT_682484 [Diaporthaceae sp. PMI_573]